MNAKLKKVSNLSKEIILIVVDYFTRTCMRGFVATRPLYSDVYHYVYICVVQPSAEHFLFRTHVPGTQYRR